MSVLSLALWSETIFIFTLITEISDLRPDYLVEIAGALQVSSSIFLLYICAPAPPLLQDCLISQLSQHKNCFILKYSDLPFIRGWRGGRGGGLICKYVSSEAVFV